MRRKWKLGTFVFIIVAMFGGALFFTKTEKGKALWAKWFPDTTK